MTIGREWVTGYFATCTAGNAHEIASYFLDDAIVYDTNHTPVRGAAAIGKFFVRIRAQWGGACWHIDTYVGDACGAAIEWTMIVSLRGREQAVRGSEHYEFGGNRIAQIRQYWTFDPGTVATGLRDYPYADDSRFVMPE